MNRADTSKQTEVTFTNDTYNQQRLVVIRGIAGNRSACMEARQGKKPTSKLEKRKFIRFFYLESGDR